MHLEPLVAPKKSLSAAGGEAFEPAGESIPIRLPRAFARQLDLLLVKRLEQIKHWPVFIVEQAPRDVHAVIRSNAHEILIEGAVMNRAKAQPVRDVRVTFVLEVANDVRGVKQTRLPETTDRTAALVRNENPPAKARLVQSNARLANCIFPFQWIGCWDSLTFV